WCAAPHRLNRDIVKLLARPAFHDASLAADVAFLGGPFPFSADISVREILAARPGIDAAGRAAGLAARGGAPALRVAASADRTPALPQAHGPRRPAPPRPAAARPGADAARGAARRGDG